MNDSLCLLHQEIQRIHPKVILYDIHSVFVLSFPYYLSFQEQVSLGFSREQFYPIAYFLSKCVPKVPASLYPWGFTSEEERML